nr:fatty acid desaturase [Bacteroidia bacterium]
MRTSKELILASKEFTKENRFKSWLETLLTAVLVFVALFITYLNIPVLVKLPVSILAALLLVRLFIIYHDYQHHTILQHSKIADLMMKAFGVFMLAPQNIWKRSHDHHHHHNSKLTLSGIGSYPTISTQRYFKL